MIAILYFFWPNYAACGILVPQPGIEPRPSAVKAQSPNHWTAREFPTAILTDDARWGEKRDSHVLSTSS